MKIQHSAYARSILVVCLLAMSCLAQTLQAKVHLKIAVGDARIAGAFNHWTSAIPWSEIKSFKNEDAIRPVMDLILQLQALKIGGLDFDFELVVYPGYERAKLETVQGNTDLSAETFWDNDIAANAGTLLKSDAVIRNGEFEKGIYVLPTNTAILKVKSAEELKNFVGAVVAGWSLDVKLIDAMQPKATEKPGKFENVVLMLEKGRADFTLAEFSSKSDLSVEQNGVRLVPIPNIKVALNGSRSWVVAKVSPNATEIFKALDKGTKALRADGTIERAFKESGFLNQAVASWKRLY
jgi:hypothetical protein